jgi:DNA-binding LytR/AlgR family response regulator
LLELLEAEGYAVVGPARSGARAQELFARHRVDLLLCDIRIQGPEDGIQTAQRLLAQRPMPLIFLTSLTDPATLARALPTGPAAYLPKPVTAETLRTAIELAMHQFATLRALPPPNAPATTRAAGERESLSRETILQLDQHVFLKHQQQFVRVPLAEILWLEADNNYTTLVTAARRYALRLALNTVLERLASPRLVRVHRSFAVSLPHVEAFSEQDITVAGQVLPLSRHYREEFLRRFAFR